MILKAYYSGGRIDVFDTDHHVDAAPQRGNLLANYTLDLSDVAGDGLWLRSYYHEAAEAYREEPGPTGLPVARRRDGWSFLIADADDLDRLNRLTVDGETILARIAGELVDIAALAWAYDVSEEYPSLILSAFRSPNLVSPEGDKDMSEEIGVPRSVIEAASREFTSTDSSLTPHECRF